MITQKDVKTLALMVVAGVIVTLLADKVRKKLQEPYNRWNR